MACGIKIESVVGHAVSLPPAGCRTLITVSGIKVSYSPPSCLAVAVAIRCKCGATVCDAWGSVDSNGVLTNNPHSGYLVNDHWQLTLLASCCCNEPVEITAACIDGSGIVLCKESGTLPKLPCDSICCPNVTADAAYGPCDANGHSDVTITVHVAAGNGPSDCPPAVIAIDYGDGSSQSAPHSFNGPGSFAWPPHNYGPGTYLAQIVVLTPEHCPLPGLPIKVTCPPEGCCPTVTTTLRYGPCEANGDSLVTLVTNFAVPKDCPPAEVWIDFGDNGTLDGPYALSGSGSFTTTRLYHSGQYQGYVVVTAPEHCPAAPFTINSPCPPEGCCPEIGIEAAQGPCENGEAVVTLTTHVTIPDGCPPVDLRISFGDGSQGALHHLTGSGTVTDSHPYPAGSHTAAVDVLSPAGCGAIEKTFEVTCEPPPCCPQVSPKVSVGPCDATGNAQVTIEIAVTPAADPHCPKPEVQVNYGHGDLGGVHSNSFSETRNYGAGLHFAVVKILSPAGCAPVPFAIFVPCPNCCPDVTIVPCVPDCSKAPDREVKFEITVTPKPAPCPPKAVTFQMDFGDGDKGQSVTIPAGGSSYSYTETHTYSGTDALQENAPALIISEPPECKGPVPTDPIPACCDKKRAKLCKRIFWFMSWAFTLALLYLLLWALGGPSACANCGPFVPGPQTLYFFYVFAIIGVLLVALYLWLHCPKCRCGWVWLLLWRMLFGAGLLYAVFARCAQQILSVVIGILLIMLAFFILKQWKNKCCVSECKYLGEILFWGVLNLGTLIGILVVQASGCVYSFSFTLFGTTISIVLWHIAAVMLAAVGMRYLDECG